MIVYSVTFEYQTSLPGKWQRQNVHILIDSSDYMNDCHKALQQQFGRGRFRILSVVPAQLALPIILDTYYGQDR